MAIEYKYPRVTISTLAKTHSVRMPERADTTVLFQPIYAKKGPVDNIVRLFTVDELITTYGEPDFATQGQSILNAINWLKNGGTVYATRVDQPSNLSMLASAASGKITGKYPGEYYDNITVTFTWEYKADANTKTGKAYSFTAKIGDYETFKAQTLKELIIRINDSSDYINIDTDFAISDLSKKTESYTLKAFDTNPHPIHKDFIYSGEKISLFNDALIDLNSRLGIVPGLSDISEFNKIYFDLGTGYDYLGVTYFTGYDCFYAFHCQYIDNTETWDAEEICRVTFADPDLEVNEYLKIFISELSKSSNYPESLRTQITPLLKYFTCIVTSINDGSIPEKSVDFDEIFKAQPSIKAVEFSADTLIASLFGTIASDGKFSVNNDGIVKLLGNKLETPIDVILDAGYSENTKKVISEYTKNKNQVLEQPRQDIVCIFDEYINGYANDKYTGKRPTKGSLDCIEKCDNRAVYTQYFLVDDDYAKNIWVTPTYFLAKLIPHNDRVYGVQWPTAGLTRGVLLDVKDINENPTPNIKNSNFLDRINYVERDANGYKFMSQRTYDGSDETEYTALSFLNNTRALAKMVKELEKIGREYLFEFNDATTLANMRNALNRHMGEWVSNRTLNFAEVDVAASEYSDEAVDVTLNIRFTGTIGVISVDIIIE